MGQLAFPPPRFPVKVIGLALGIVLLFAIVITLVLWPSWHRGSNSVPATTAREPRIVSLLPESTDILVSIGCRDHLVAVSNYDADPEVAGLPRVGDYQRTNWETISSLHAQWIITHYGPGKVPAGFVERADALGARRLNLQTETIDSGEKTQTIFYAIEELGKACNEPVKASQASAGLRARLDVIRKRGKGLSSVSTLIIIGSEGTMVAGRNTFLNELLEMAGGSNAAAGMNAGYPRVEREQMVAMRPEVILQLIPSASPQVIEQARAFWASPAFAEVPAVKNGRVVQITEWYALLPGYHVADLGEKFEAALHPTWTPPQPPRSGSTPADFPN